MTSFFFKSIQIVSCLVHYWKISFILKFGDSLKRLYLLHAIWWDKTQLVWKFVVGRAYMLFVLLYKKNFSESMINH